MSKMNDGNWRERVTAVKEGRKPKVARNDRVADLWGQYGWGEDDFFAEEPEGLGQRTVNSYKGRSERLKRIYNERDQQVSRVGDNTARRAITAHGMVQSFISAFSDEWGYRVVYSLNAGAPAATSFETKTVLVDPTPIFDNTISATRAGLVMTALACHEVSHILFDRHHGDAVDATVKQNRALARRLSNILSDRRIERRFAARYPGYSDVFDPALEYISREHHGKSITFNPADPGNLVVAAVRYARWLDWSAPGMDDERIWWDDLAERAALKDDVDWHVQHVIEGMKRINKMKKGYVEPHPFKP